MCLHPTPCNAIPDATVAIARAAFPRGTPYLRLREALEPIFTDTQFAPLFAHRGQPAACPWRLALVTLLQYAETLSDRRAAEAARGRIDWKYLLGLDLGDPGFDASILSEFRSRLVAGGAEEQLLDTLLDLCREHKLLTARGRQRTDAVNADLKLGSWKFGVTIHGLSFLKEAARSRCRPFGRVHRHMEGCALQHGPILEPCSALDRLPFQPSTS